jgi:hypothetical protein
VPQENSTLSADRGEWSGSRTSFDYYWTRCDKNGDDCKPIDGATGETYELRQGDVGHTLRVTVTAANVDGSAQSTSAPSARIVAAAPPANTLLPTIAGAVQVGSTLTADNGSWNGSPESYAYSWSRCDENGGSCAAIGGATNQSYQLKQVDAGTTPRITVTAANSAGSSPATSAPTMLVPVPAGFTPPAVVATGCPTGTGLIQVADVGAPARLSIGGQTMTPGDATPSVTSVQLHFRVTACEGRPVQGALVYATAVPFNQYSIPVEATTGLRRRGEPDDDAAARLLGGEAAAAAGRVRPCPSAGRPDRRRDLDPAARLVPRFACRLRRFAASSLRQEDGVARSINRHKGPLATAKDRPA